MIPIDTITKDKEVISFISVLSDMEKTANEFEIKTNDNEKQGITYTGQLKEMKKKIEDRRKHYVQGPSDYVKQVNNMFKPFRDQIDNVDRIIRKKMIIFRQELEEKERKRIEKAKAKDKPVIERKVEQTSYSGGTAATYKKVWKFEIENEKKIPRDYLIINESAIRIAIRNGIRNIAGVKIFETKELSVR